MREGIEMKPQLTGGSNSTIDLKLTRIERNILELAKRGLTRKGIAEHLNRSVHTINTHVESIYQKFGVNNMACAIAKFLSEARNW